MMLPRWTACQIPSRSWGLILLVAILPFLNSLPNGFHDDDEHAIRRNHHLRSIGNIPSFFVDSATFSAEPGKGMYRPVLQTTMVFNYLAGGYDPSGYHLVSIAFHALTCIGLLLLAGRFLPPPLALAVALLFAVHPIHTQAINYISSRSELMAVCGVIWGLWCALTGRTWMGVGLFTLALLSKSVALHLLPILWLALWISQEGKEKWRVLGPFSAVAIVYVGVISLEGFLPHSLGQQVRPFELHLAAQMKGMVLYLHMITMPVRLSIEHGLLPGRAAAPTAMAGLTFIGSVAGCAVVGLRHRVWKIPGFGLTWFFLGLSITTLIPLTVVTSEQRLYLSTAGVILALAALCHGGHQGRRSGVLFAVALIFMATLSVARNDLWENELTLWSDAVEKAPATVRAQGNVALALHEAGELEAAGQHYEQALRLDPGQPRIRTNYGVWLEDVGRWAEAEEQYLQAATYRWAGARTQLGRLYLAQGRAEAARAQLDTALMLNPADTDAILHLARWYQVAEDPLAARRLYEQVLSMDPQDPAAANNLGLMLVEAGELEAGRELQHLSARVDPGGESSIHLAYLDLRAAGKSASQAYRQLWTLHPDRAAVALGLVQALAREGAWSEALEVVEEARARVPGDIDLIIAAGDAHRAVGNWAMAIAAYEKATRFRPREISVRNRLAAALGAAGKVEQALKQTRLVLAQDSTNSVARTNLQRLLHAPAAMPTKPESGPVEMP